MRFVTYRAETGPRPGVVIGDHIVDVLDTEVGRSNPACASVRGLLELGSSLQAEVLAAAEAVDPERRLPRGTVRLAPPILDPDKVLCVGLNYVSHQEESKGIAEVAASIPSIPMIFNKFTTSLIGDGDPISAPAAESKLDWEAELGVVIGKTARHVSVDSALDHVAGYLPFNDVSARELQLRSPQWAIGKGFDTSGPMGPELVLADEVPDPQDLTVRARLNGETVQEGSTGDMIFSVAELIEYISSAITLVPGDVIATGTPAGVGIGRKPPLFMQPGDTIEVEVEGIGVLTNPVEAPVSFISQLERREHV